MVPGGEGIANLEVAAEAGQHVCQLDEAGAQLVKGFDVARVCGGEEG